MRVDKFLKVARVLKRRAISKELADNDRILINNKVAKPSTTVKVDDLITVIFGNRSITIQVTQIFDHIKKEEADTMYKIVEELREVRNNE